MKKNIIYKSEKLLLLIFVLGSFNNTTIIAQNNKSGERIYMKAELFQSENKQELKATVSARIGEKRKMLPVEGLPVSFYNVIDTSEFLLATISSDTNGDAVLLLSQEINIEKNAEGGFSFEIRFEGDDIYKKASKDISFREVKIEIAFIEIDSIKVVHAKAYETGIEGGRIPLEETDIKFYVPGSFSLYTIGEGSFEKGICEINFPVTMPGDSIGNLTIIARIEESDDFGNVEARAVKDWGVVREPVIIKSNRGLGDTDAPLWMVYTLLVLLSIVWIHYIYVFVVIYMIKKEAKVSKV